MVAFEEDSSGQSCWFGLVGLGCRRRGRDSAPARPGRDFLVPCLHFSPVNEPALSRLRRDARRTRITAWTPSGRLLLESLPGPGLPAHCRGPLVAHAPRAPGPANLRLPAASPSRRRCRVCDLAQCAHTRAIMARAAVAGFGRRIRSLKSRHSQPRPRCGLRQAGKHAEDGRGTAQIDRRLRRHRARAPLRQRSGSASPPNWAPTCSGCIGKDIADDEDLGATCPALLFLATVLRDTGCRHCDPSFLKWTPWGYVSGKTVARGNTGGQL